MDKRILDILICDLEKLTEDLRAVVAEGQQVPEPEKTQTETPAPHSEKEKFPKIEKAKPAEKVIEFTEVRKTLSRLSAEGHTTEVRELIKSFGVSRLSDVPQEKYPELMEKAEVLNGK